MKKEKNETKNKRKVNSTKKDIHALIDDLAYQDEKKNIQKSKRFLDNLYLLDQQ